MKRQWWKWVAAWICAAMFYTWCNGKLEEQQLIASAIVALPVIVALAWVVSLAKISFSFRWRWVGIAVRRLPGRIIRGMGKVAALPLQGKHVTGKFHHRSFKRGGADPKSAGRRALVFGEISLPPNSYALTLGPGRKLLVHELAPEGPPQDSEWPV